MINDNYMDVEASGSAIDIDRIEKILSQSSFDVGFSQIKNTFLGLKNDSKNKITERIYHIRQLANIANVIGRESTSKIIVPIVVDLLEDQYAEIRRCAIRQSTEIAFFLYKDNIPYYKDILTLLESIQKNMIDDNANVRSDVTNSITQIDSLFEGNNITTRLVHLIKPSLKKKRGEQELIESIVLMNQYDFLVMKNDLCFYFVRKHLPRLVNSDSYIVRKSISSNLSNICEEVGTHEVERNVIPLFIKLCKDKEWVVRESCVSNIACLSKHVSYKARNELLVPIIYELIEDISTQVKNRSAKVIGKFISTFTGSIVPERLVYYFNKSVEMTSEAHYDIAYVFPAVIYTIGGRNWKEVHTSYQILTRNYDTRVKMCLAASIHDICTIVGRKNTEDYLLTTLVHFIRYRVNVDIQMKVIPNIASILAILSDEMKDKKSFIITEILLNNNWRIRRLLAQQMDKLYSIYTFNHKMRRGLINTFVALRDDGVASVRNALVDCIPGILKVISDQEVLEQFTKNLKVLASKNMTYHKKQMYIRLCELLYSYDDQDFLFNTLFEPLCQLSKDHVPNVRGALYRSVQKSLKYGTIKKERIKKTQELLQMIKVEDIVDIVDVI